MKKKITAIVVLLCMVCSTLVGCQSVQQSFYETVRKTGDIKQFDYEMEMDILSNEKDEETGETTNIDVKAKLSGTYNSETEMSMKIECMTNEMEKYVTLTDIYMLENEMYINIKLLISALETLSGVESGSVSQMFQLSGDYLKLDTNELVESANNLAEEELEKMDLKDADKYVEVIEDIKNIAINFMEQATKEMDVITKDGDTFTFSVTEENLQQLINSIGKIFRENIETEVDTIIKKYEKKGNEYSEIVTTLKDFKENDLNDLKEELKEMEDYKHDKEKKLDGKMSLSLVGKENERVLNSSIKMNTSYKESKSDILLSVRLNEHNGNKKIEAPRSVISEEELQSLFQLFGMGLGNVTM